MINCIIVDDEEHAIEIIEDYIKSTQLNLVATFKNPLQALSFLKETNIDLVFLDIQMPELSGLEFIELMAEKTTTIITTACVDFAKQSYDHNAIDFLLKPVTLKRFLQATSKVEKALSMRKLVAEHKMSTDYFMVKTETKGKMLKINTSDIDFVQGMKNYIAIHHNGDRTLALLTMKDVEDRLPKNKFVRVQKSFIIAIDKIKSIDGNKVVLRGISDEILIGDIYKKNFLDMLKQRLIA